MTRGGLPHSDIFGSKLVCSSPKLFAACHVLHRLLAPRHSPYTLSSLTIRNSKLTLTNRLHIDWSATVPCNTACPPSRLRATADECCGRKKLPCAEYSIVKDQACRASPDNLFTSGTGRSATRAALKRSVPTSVQERPEGLITPPKLFKERVYLTTAYNPQPGLPTVARSCSLTAPTSALRATAGNLRVHS